MPPWLHPGRCARNSFTLEELLQALRVGFRRLGGGVHAAGKSSLQAYDARMLFLYALTLATTLQHGDAADAGPAETSEVDAISCRLEVPGYMQFAMAIDGEEKLAQMSPPHHGFSDLSINARLPNCGICPLARLGPRPEIQAKVSGPCCR